MGNETRCLSFFKIWQFPTIFLVNCYSNSLLLNRYEYLKFVGVINGFLTLDEIAFTFKRGRVKKKTLFSSTIKMSYESMEQEMRTYMQPTV